MRKAKRERWLWKRVGSTRYAFELPALHNRISGSRARYTPHAAANDPVPASPHGLKRSRVDIDDASPLETDWVGRLSAWLAHRHVAAAVSEPNDGADRAPARYYRRKFRSRRLTARGLALDDPTLEPACTRSDTATVARIIAMSA
jgi:hypothetical protein